MGISLAAVVDTFGIPEFFTTHAQLENAGSGMVRVIRLVERGGMMVPVFCYVTPAVCMIRTRPDHRAFAEAVLKSEMLVIGPH